MNSLSLGRVLVVDDQPELLQTLCEELAGHGYEVQGRATGPEALQALQEQDFDLLLCDLMMPGMDGIGLLRGSLEIDPFLVGVLMTGQGTVQTAVGAMKAGAFDYVLKPFKLSALLPVISRAMEARRLRLENLQLRETVAIYELSQAVVFNLDLQTLLNKVVDAALQQCQGDEVSLLLPAEQGEDFYVAVARGPHREHILGQRVQLGQGIAGWVARHRQPVVLHGVVDDLRFAPTMPRPEIHSSICVPMLAGGELVGILNVNTTHPCRPFSLGQVKVLNLLLSTGASALKNARLYAQMRQRESALYQAQKMEALGQLAGGIVHDFNNIVTVITGYSQVLMKGLEPESRQWHNAEEIHKAGVRAEHLIRQLLAFSRTEELRTVLIDLNQVVGETEGMLGPLLGRRFELVLAKAHEPLPVEVGAGQLEQVLMNLVVNARDAMPQGGRIEVEAGLAVLGAPRHTGQEVVPAGWYAVLRVRDAGIGMDEATRRRIFEPFFTTKPTGTGLGLATVFGIAKQHGGYLEVESAPGQGSCFSVYLPKAEAAAPLPSGDRKAILVLDDESGVRQGICQLLRAAGYRVVEGAHPPGVLEMNDQGKLDLDLLVTDVVMPEMDGVELAARLRQGRPGLMVLYISGYATQEIFAGGAPEPGAIFLPKPFRSEELVRQVREMLAGRGGHA